MKPKGNTSRWRRWLKLCGIGTEEGLGHEYLQDPDIHVVLRAKYLYIAYMRDLCEDLALETGFDENEAFAIKLAFDEILTNAFEHGCTHPGDDKIEIRISFAGTGAFVCIRDPGGKPFDYRRYKGFHEKFPDAIGSGLCLVDKFTGEWVVNTKSGEYTDVMFFKKKSEREEK